MTASAVKLISTIVAHVIPVLFTSVRFAYRPAMVLGRPGSAPSREEAKEQDEVGEETVEIVGVVVVVMAVAIAAMTIAALAVVGVAAMAGIASEAIQTLAKKTITSSAMTSGRLLLLIRILLCTRIYMQVEFIRT